VKEPINTKFYLQVYELVRSKADVATSQKAVNTIERILKPKSDSFATKSDLIQIRNFLVKWSLVFFLVLAILILGLYATLFFFS
jgi:hypothetical protein